MDLGIKGKRAFVTGSTAGLGEAIAKLLAAEGAKVVVHGRDRERAARVAAAIGGADVVLGDLTTDASAEAVAKAAGEVDILVNNAGGFGHSEWMTTSSAAWAERYEANVLSGVRMIQRFVPAMKARGWGRVITIGGGLALQPGAHFPEYNATLAARHNLAVSLARALAGTGVTSNVVAPGAIRTDAVESLLRAAGLGGTWDEIERAAVEKVAPNDIGRFGRPEEIAAAVAFLTSAHAGYISGATLRVDGGTIRGV